MGDIVKALYKNAVRFDEGALYRGEEYRRLAACELCLRELGELAFGPGIALFLEQFAAILWEEDELENQHFFEQGYLMGKSCK